MGQKILFLKGKKMQITYKQEILRKLVHLSSLWMVLLIYFVPAPVAALTFFVLLIGNLFIEYAAYRYWPFFHSFFNYFFSKMMRSKERVKGFHPSGAPYVLTAALLASCLFPTVIAMFSLTVMLLCDTAAALIGRRFGKHKIGKSPKTIEGAVSFWVTGFLVLLFYTFVFHFSDLSVFQGLIAITLAMFAEIYEEQIKLDDNLSIPLICGVLMTLSVL